MAEGNNKPRFDGYDVDAKVTAYGLDASGPKARVAYAKWLRKVANDIEYGGERFAFMATFRLLSKK